MKILLCIASLLLLACSKPVLNESAARTLATKLADEKVKKVELSYGDGELIPPEEIPTSNWISVYKKNKKWHLNIVPPAGVSTYVEFDLDGSNPKIEFIYTPD